MNNKIKSEILMVILDMFVLVIITYFAVDEFLNHNIFDGIIFGILVVSYVINCILIRIIKNPIKKGIAEYSFLLFFFLLLATILFHNGKIFWAILASVLALPYVRRIYYNAKYYNQEIK